MSAPTLLERARQYLREQHHDESLATYLEQFALRELTAFHDPHLAAAYQAGRQDMLRSLASGLKKALSSEAVDVIMRDVGRILEAQR